MLIGFKQSEFILMLGNMQRKLVLLIVLLLFVTMSLAESNTPLDQESLNKYSPKTELSKKAMHLRVGMTKGEVIKLLGEPTWAKTYKGMPLDWMYRNEKCNPVDVTFDKDYYVNGFDQGRARCLKSTFSESLPDDKSLCSNPKNRALCHA